jgi:hypothetical protein
MGTNPEIQVQQISISQSNIDQNGFIKQEKVSAITEKIATTYNLPSEVANRGENVKIKFIEKEEFADKLASYLKEIGISKINETMSNLRDEDTQGIINLLEPLTGLEKEELSQKIKLLVDRKLPTLGGINIGNLIYIPKNYLTDKKINEIIVHEIIHALSRNKEGITGLKPEKSKQYNDLNEAATQILTLHVFYPDLNEKEIIEKIRSGEIETIYPEAVMKMLTLMASTSKSQNPVTIDKLAYYYFNNQDGTAPIMLAMDIQKNSYKTVSDLESYKRIFNDLFEMK